MESNFTFLRVRGIPIGAHWTWLLVFGLLSWSLATALFPGASPGLGASTYALMGIVTTLLFFASIVLHELGHTFRAIKEGMQIDGITLWLFGGVARFRGMFPSAGAELRIAVAGPAVSVGLVLAFAAVAALPVPREVRGVAEYLAYINAILVGFNLIPALPLDGGRVLRAWLWRRESFAAATRSAARAGKAFGGLLTVIGVLGFVSGTGLGGLWLVFLGFFLIQAADAEESVILLQRAFEGRRVRDVMTADPVVVPPDMSVIDFLGQVNGARHSTYPVVDHGRPVGLVALRQIALLPETERRAARVGEVMLKGGAVPVVHPDTPVMEAIDAVRDAGRALVVDNERLIGIVSGRDLARTVEVARAQGVSEPPPAGRKGMFVWAVVSLIMVLAAGILYTPPFAVIAPGESIDITRDFTIEGVPTHRISGRYLLTSVRLEQANALGVLAAIARSDRQVVPVGRVVPNGVDLKEYEQQQEGVFKENQLLAAAAAADAAGLPVQVGGSGATVEGVLPSSPATRALRRGDIVVTVDGRPIRTASDFRDAVRSSPAGTSFVLGIERQGQREDVGIVSERLPLAGYGVGIGVAIATRDPSVRLPFRIQFRQRGNIGGPSAGLAYALAIADALDATDDAQERSISATGTVNPEGEVGPVGGVAEKAIAARRAGARLLFVPSEEVRDVKTSDLEVRGVSSVNTALETLRGSA
ncbi:MAG: CBS domain-containing protein [Actinomycetota bacterium]|nr:CBS domain-containing protein [Actinomycetota bacterium]